MGLGFRREPCAARNGVRVSAASGQAEETRRGGGVLGFGGGCLIHCCAFAFWGGVVMVWTVVMARVGAVYKGGRGGLVYSCTVVVSWRGRRHGGCQMRLVFKNRAFSCCIDKIIITDVHSFATCSSPHAPSLDTVCLCNTCLEVFKAVCPKPRFTCGREVANPSARRPDEGLSVLPLLRRSLYWPSSARMRPCLPHGRSTRPPAPRCRSVRSSRA